MSIYAVTFDVCITNPSGVDKFVVKISKQFSASSLSCDKMQLKIAHRGVMM